MGVTHADICGADDDDGIDRLQSVLRELGFLGNTDNFDSSLGVGLSEFRRGADELTVFIDAWVVDIAGPEAAVREVVAALSGN
jgi:hypothetical protein